MNVRDSEGESKNPWARRVCPHWRRTVDGIIMASAWHDGRVRHASFPQISLLIYYCFPQPQPRAPGSASSANPHSIRVWDE